MKKNIQIVGFTFALAFMIYNICDHDYIGAIACFGLLIIIGNNVYEYSKSK